MWNNRTFDGIERGLSAAANDERLIFEDVEGRQSPGRKADILPADPSCATAPEHLVQNGDDCDVYVHHAPGVFGEPDSDDDVGDLAVKVFCKEDTVNRCYKVDAEGNRICDWRATVASKLVLIPLGGAR